MSNFIDWSDDLSVGVEQIDEQHKKLVSLVNEMHEAITERRASEAAMEVLDQLILYTQTHFQMEEALMDLLEYEGFEEHKARHDELIEQVGELRTKLESGKASINFALMHFLKRWLTNHILGDDAEMGAYFLAVKKTPRRKRSLFGRLGRALWGRKSGPAHSATGVGLASR